MDVVRFAHCHIIGRELVHYLCEVLVDGREYAYSQTEVGRPEQCLAAFGTKSLHFVSMFRHPARTAGYQFDPGAECLHIVIVCNHGVGELYGNVGALEGCRFKVFLIVDIDDAYNFVSAAKGYFLDFLAHFSVAD